MTYATAYAVPVRRYREDGAGKTVQRDPRAGMPGARGDVFYPAAAPAVRPRSLADHMADAGARAEFDPRRVRTGGSASSHPIFTQPMPFTVTSTGAPAAAASAIRGRSATCGRP